MDERTILVTGATGQQGGAVARALFAEGWKVRAFVRDPGKPAAQDLESLGAELTVGDLNDTASVERALAGAYGVYAVQTPMTPEGTAGEVRQGEALADAARRAGVEHFVSLESGDVRTMPEVAKMMEAQFGKPVRFGELPIEAIRGFSEDLALMFEWFNSAGQKPDVAALRRLHAALMDFPAWLKASGWWPAAD
jgi:NAD(P)-dependent dehydrogenase (short-subunit alcohol dehydrogenase family)